jgi:pSer/pThr/pTyr-binding forkhead associated (FHA) protein
MLIVTVTSTTDGSKRTLRFDKRVVSLGARPDNDVVLEDPRVSSRHATLELSERGLMLDDSSTNGSFVRGERVRRGLLVHGEMVSIAPFEVEAEASRPPLGPDLALGDAVRTPLETVTLQPLQSRGGGALPAPIALRGVPVLLGASSKAEYRLVHPLVSGRHAELTLVGGLLKLRDLGSTNGTFVNGNRVSLGFARPGDAVAFGPDVWFLVAA